MTGRLTRTASAVTLHAGLFTASPQSTSAQLTAYRANNTQVGSVTVPVSAAGFTSALTVTSAAPDIARFRPDRNRAWRHEFESRLRRPDS
jgi:hypothetical protein